MRRIAAEFIGIAADPHSSAKLSTVGPAEAHGGDLKAVGPENLEAIRTNCPPRRPRKAVRSWEGDIGRDRPATATCARRVEANNRRECVISRVNAEWARPVASNEPVASRCPWCGY